MPDDVSWELNEDLATLRCGTFRASINVRLPERGLHAATLEERPLRSCQFLGVAIRAERADAIEDLYVRGGDLIVRYAQAGRPYAVSVYWRAGRSGGMPRIDLLVSVDTSLLDSRPRLEAQTWLAIPANAVTLSPSHYAIGRLSDPATSYIEVSQPDDALMPLVRPCADGVRLATGLFGQPLEKGVILRSRLRGLFVPHGDEEPRAVAAVADFAAAPPPLTT
jgi:hypothetical protein